MSAENSKNSDFVFFNKKSKGLFDETFSADWSLFCAEIVYWSVIETNLFSSVIKDALIRLLLSYKK